MSIKTSRPLQHPWYCIDKESIQVEFARFIYDLEKSATAMDDSVLPNDYADMLRNGV